MSSYPNLKHCRIWSTLKATQSEFFTSSFLTCWHSDTTSRHRWRAFRTFLLDSIALVFTSLLSLKHAVHTFDSFTTIVNTFWTNALAAGVMEPAVFGCPHGLTGYLTLMYGHAVIKINHSTHVLWKIKKLRF